MLRKEDVDWPVMDTAMNLGNFLTNGAIISFPRQTREDYTEWQTADCSMTLYQLLPIIREEAHIRWTWQLGRSLFQVIILAFTHRRTQANHETLNPNSRCSNQDSNWVRITPEYIWKCCGSNQLGWKNGNVENGFKETGWEQRAGWK
jgi:hypothetical protein